MFDKKNPKEFLGTEITKKNPIKYFAPKNPQIIFDKHINTKQKLYKTKFRKYTWQSK